MADRLIASRAVEGRERVACACALDRSRGHRRVLRPRPRQSRSAAADRHSLSHRPRVPARAPLRPGAASRCDLHPRRQRGVRVPGARARRAHGTYGRVRAAVRHQHGVAVCPRVPGDATGEGPGRKGRRGRPRARRVAGGSAGDIRDRRDRAWVCLRRRARAQGDPAGGAPLDPRGHRPGVHLARLSLPHLRASGRGADNAGDRDADLLRSRALQGTPSRRCRGRDAGDTPVLDHRDRAGRRTALPCRPSTSPSPSSAT